MEEELKALGVSAKGYQSNAADFNAAQELAKEVLKEFGAIDILVNNAGITKDNLLMRMGEEDFDKVIEVNLKSVFNMTKAVQRTMLKQRKGSIINMSSVVGVKGNAGQTNYAASKAGLIGFTKSIAAELGSRNIRCNAIAPGPFPTWMLSAGVGFGGETDVDWSSVGESNPRGRVGTPEDIAGLAIFLSSRAGAFTVGEVITCDGGSVACA